MRVGETGKYFIRGWNRKAGRGNKDLKRGGGKLGQGVGALKKGGVETPLWAMIKCSHFITSSRAAYYSANSFMWYRKK